MSIRKADASSYRPRSCKSSHLRELRRELELIHQRVGHVVEVMCQVFSAKEHPITMALRDESDTLVTQSNLPSKVIHNVKLKYVSPVSRAVCS